MEGRFSRAPLAALLAAECTVGAVVVPRPTGVAGDGAPLRVLLPPRRRPHALPLVAVRSEPTIVGLGNAGITVHLLDDHADAGDVVAQAPIVLPDGITYCSAERVCSHEGARLLIDALAALAAGSLMRTPQPHIDLPTAPVPTDADFVITPDWSARRAFNFIRGVEEWGRPMTISIGDEHFVVREAVSYDEAATM